jgi:hypothetical protein
MGGPLIDIAPHLETCGHVVVGTQHRISRARVFDDQTRALASSTDACLAASRALLRRIDDVARIDVHAHASVGDG